MKNEIIIYHTEDGRAQIHLHLENGTIWLSQSEIAELFQTTCRKASGRANSDDHERLGNAS